MMSATSVTASHKTARQTQSPPRAPHRPSRALGTQRQRAQYMLATVEHESADQLHERRHISTLPPSPALLHSASATLPCCIRPSDHIRITEHCCTFSCGLRSSRARREDGERNQKGDTRNTANESRWASHTQSLGPHPRLTGSRPVPSSCP